MTLRRLKLLAILAPLLFLGALQLARQVISPAFFQGWPGYLLLAGIVLGTLFFAEAIFGVVGRLQTQLAQQNQELWPSTMLPLGILGELDLETVLQQVVDRARDLVGARYGALLREGGGSKHSSPLASPPRRERIGPIPVGTGCSRSSWSRGSRCGSTISTAIDRLACITRQCTHSLPVVSHGRVLGNLYLTEKEAEPTFDADDEETLARLRRSPPWLSRTRASTARCGRWRSPRTERIAREMHDSIAQVLGYVNTKAQAAQTLLENDQPSAAAQLGQLSEAAREAYADVREGILGLRTSLGEDRGFIETLQDYLDRWQAERGDRRVATVTAGYDPGLAPMSEVQLRIIQEALSNVRKHAKARRAWVRLQPAGVGVEVVIEDDGAGFDPDGPVDRICQGSAWRRCERAEAVGARSRLLRCLMREPRVIVHIPAEPKAAMREETTVARADRGDHALFRDGLRSLSRRMVSTSWPRRATARSSWRGSITRTSAHGPHHAGARRARRHPPLTGACRRSRSWCSRVRGRCRSLRGGEIGRAGGSCRKI